MGEWPIMSPRNLCAIDACKKGGLPRSALWQSFNIQVCIDGTSKPRDIVFLTVTIQELAFNQKLSAGHGLETRQVMCIEGIRVAARSDSDTINKEEINRFGAGHEAPKNSGVRVRA